MSFTDEDLKRLKECLEDYPDMDWQGFHKNDFEALIARLEAAEDCIDTHRGDCLEDMGKDCSCGYSEKLEWWRKAAGK